MKVFPIYEDGGYEEDYFTAAQGSKDGKLATQAALKLGLPPGTVIYFAVDVDIQEGDITGTVVPYLNAVKANLATTIYNPGVYGTRNVCLHAQDDLGYDYSFVADMSYGWSGNMGYRMPENWAFDQFTGYTAYNVEIDQDAASDRDLGVSSVYVSGTNEEFFEKLKLVETAAQNYAASISSPSPILQYICQFYRQQDYGGVEWAVIDGNIDPTWLLEVNEQLGGLSTTTPFGVLLDNATGQEVDIPHMFATLGSLVNTDASSFTSGIPDLAGWCGDLATSIADAHNDLSQYDSMHDSLGAHIGKLGQFGPQD